MKTLAKWKRAWRTAIAPNLTARGLEALRVALVNDDRRLIQGRAALPGPGRPDAVCEAGCAVAFAFWIGHGLRTVGEVEFYVWTVRGADVNKVTDFMNWFDVTKRDVMRRELLVELERVLNRRRLASTSPRRPVALAV